jgi:ascorbate-specific PTS system EIIC-type component UlaA
MEEIRSSNAGQRLGVAGFVIGLIALIVSFIPCLGMYALVPGIIALIFSAIAFSQANSASAPKGLIIAALIISILGISIASWQIRTLRRSALNFGFGSTGKEEVPEDTISFDSEKMIRELERLEEERKNDNQ